MKEKGNIQEVTNAIVLRGSGINELLSAHGKYDAKCFDAQGNLKWADTIDNVVTNVGANLMLDTMFGGPQNTTYFIGLISSVGYTGIPVTTDTMASHPSWVEAGNSTNYPLWSTPAADARATITWSAAANRTIAIAAVASFVIAGTGGTVIGCFIVTGSGAVATNNSTAGTLYSAGVFTGGNKVVSVGDTLQVTYATSC